MLRGYALAISAEHYTPLLVIMTKFVIVPALLLAGISIAALITDVSATLQLLLIAPCIVFIGAVLSLQGSPAEQEVGANGQLSNSAELSPVRSPVQDAPAMNAGDAVTFPIVASIALGGLFAAFKFFSSVYINAVVNAYLGLGAVLAGAVMWQPLVQGNLCGGRPQQQYELPLIGAASWSHLPGALVTLLAVVAWCVTGHWLANNFLATTLVISSLQQVSVGKVRTAIIMLCLLFVYDIIMVFYTPLMVTVAKSLDAPIKLLFPATTGSFAGHSAAQGLLNAQDAILPLLHGNFSALLKAAPAAAAAVASNATAAAAGAIDSVAPRGDGSAMLGLGDLVVPGVFIAILLRFDAFRAGVWAPAPPAKGPELTAEEEAAAAAAAAALPVPDLEMTPLVSLDFPKPYFWTQMVGYVAALCVTLGVMWVWKHAQPALLYLVPAALLAVLLVGTWRGEWGPLMSYTEDGDEDVGMLEEIKLMLGWGATKDGAGGGLTGGEVREGGPSYAQVVKQGQDKGEASQPAGLRRRRKED